MNTQRLQEYFTVFCITASGVLAGVYLGQLAGMGNTRNLVLIMSGIVVLATILALRTRVWFLMLAGWALTGQIYMLPGRPVVRELVIAVVFGTVLIFKAMKLMRKKPQYGGLDFVMMLNLLYLFSVFVRNPVGVESFGSEKIGGKPYFEILVAIMGYWVLKQVSVTGKQAKELPLLLSFGYFFNGIIGFVTYHFPFTSPYVAGVYSGVVSLEDSQARIDESAADAAVQGREAYLAPFAANFIQLLCCYLRPMTLVSPFYLVRFLTFAACIFMILKSGHRSILIGSIAFFILSGYFRQGLNALLKTGLFAILALALAVLVQGNLFELPTTAQRTLSFLPGKWDPRVVAEAKGSTEWRTSMWKTVLASDKYIANKWFGDGFGFTREQFSQIESNNRGEGGTEEESGTQENMMIAGDYHSGPLSTLHIVGAAGMILFYWLMIYMAIYSLRLMKKARGTPFFPIIIYLGVGIVYRPFGYTFIFGAFNTALPETIFYVGLLKMLEESLHAYQQEMAAAPLEASASSGPVLHLPGRPALGGFSR